jgi:hypothetical protein
MKIFQALVSLTCAVVALDTIGIDEIRLTSEKTVMSMGVAYNSVLSGGVYLGLRNTSMEIP